MFSLKGSLGPILLALLLCWMQEAEAQLTLGVGSLNAVPRSKWQGGGGNLPAQHTARPAQTQTSTAQPQAQAQQRRPQQGAGQGRPIRRGAGMGGVHTGTRQGTVRVGPSGQSFGPTQCNFGSADPKYDGVCDHIVLQKIHRTGGRTLQGLMYLLAALQDKTVYRQLRPVSNNPDATFDFALHHTNRVDRGEFTPLFKSWEENWFHYANRTHVTTPFSMLVAIRDPFGRFVSHVNFLHGPVNFSSPDPASRVNFRFDMMKNFQARYLGLHTKADVDKFLQKAPRERLLWFLSEKFDLALALLARKCGIPAPCVAYMPISTLTHDGKGPGPTYDFYERFKAANELDQHLYDGARKLFDREVAKYGLANLKRSQACAQETQDCWVMYCQARRLEGFKAPFCRFWSLKDVDQQRLLGPEGRWVHTGPEGLYTKENVLTEWKLLTERCANVTARTCQSSFDYSKWKPH